MYQPNMLNKIHKQLFAKFQRNGILLQQKDYNSYGAGSYKAYWKTSFAETVEHREDYGRLPNRSSYDPNEDMKLRTQACPEWDFYNFRNLMWLFTFRIMTDYMLRGSQEVYDSTRIEKILLLVVYSLSCFSLITAYVAKILRLRSQTN